MTYKIKFTACEVMRATRREPGALALLIAKQRMCLSAGPHGWEPVHCACGKDCESQPPDVALLGTALVRDTSLWPRVLCVGERFNQEHYRPREDDPEFGVSLLLRLGIFRSGGDRPLRRCGLWWNQGLNLTWPDPQGAPWASETARRNAQVVHDQVTPRCDLVILCGRKVQVAFGVPSDFTQPAVFGEKYFCVPHPSGLSRQWNDPDFCASVSKRFHEETARVDERTLQEAAS